MSVEKGFQNQLLGFILVLISATSFASLGLFSSYIVRLGMSTNSLLTLRFFGSAFILLIYLAWKGQLKPYARASLIGLLLGMGGYALAAFLFMNAIVSIGMAKATILLYTYTFFAWPLRLILLRKKPKSIEVIISSISLVGCALVCNISFSMTLNELSLGLLSGLASGLIYAAYLVLNEKYLTNCSAVSSTAWITFGAGIACFISTLFTNGSGLSIFLGQALIPLLGIIIFSTIIPIMALLQGLKYIGPTKAAVISTLEPCAAAAIGAILLHQRLEDTQVLGVFVVVMSIIILETYSEIYSILTSILINMQKFLTRLRLLATALMK